MKTIKSYYFNILTFTLVMLMVVSNQVQAQDEPEVTTEEATPEVSKENRPTKYSFEAGSLVETQTFMVLPKKTLEFIIQHRFGNVNSYGFDMAGLYAPSNIRMGFNYGVIKNGQIGIGSTKVGQLVDLNYKYSILRQTETNSMPLSVTYYGNTELDIRSEKTLFGEEYNFNHRFSYFNQLIIGRKFSKVISFQVSAMHAHFNQIDTLKTPELKHSNFGIGFAGRVKFSSQGSVIFEYAMPLTTPKYDDLPDGTNPSVKPNLSLGFEFSTGGHAIQFFVSTYNRISPQNNLTYSTNDFTNQDVLIGFNLTRNWGF